MSVRRILVRTWRYLGWRHLVVALAAGALIAISVPLSSLWINFSRVPHGIVYLTRVYVIFAAFFILAVAVVEANAPRRRPTLRQYGAAGLLAAMLCLTTASVLATKFIRLPSRREIPGYVKAPPYLPQHVIPSALFAVGFDGVAHCLIGLFVYVRLRNARLAEAALHGTQLGASEARRASSSARLEAVRGRVDPEALTRSLEEIEQMYARDPARAESRLDELIGFLRSTIPEIRSEEQGGGSGIPVVQAR